MSPSAPGVKLALAALVALAWLAAPTAAQAAPALSIAPATAAVALADNQTRDLAWTVSNSGPAAATVQVTLAVPPGWRAQLAPGSSSFTLAGNAPAVGGGGSRAIQLTVSPEPGAHPSNGTLTVQATGTDAAGQSGSATATVGLVYIPPPPPPPPPANPWPLALALLGAAVVLAAAALYLFSATRLRLRLSALEIEEAAGDRATLHLLVHNRARAARRIDLRLRGLPPPWAGALMVPHVLLDADASTEVPISVSVPRQVRPGGEACAFQVQARPHGRYPWLVRRRVQARIRGAAPPPPVAAEPVPQA